MKGFLEEFYENLVEIQKKHVWASLFVLVAITGFFLFFALRLEVDSTLDQQLKPEGDYLTLKNVLSDEFGETDSFFVVVRFDESAPDRPLTCDLRCPEVIKSIESLEKSLSNESEVNSVASIAGVFRTAFGRLPESLEESKEWLRLIGPSARGFFNDDMSATIINVGVDISNKPGVRDEVEKRLFERVADSPFPNWVKVSLTGFPTLLNQIIKLMINDSMKTLLLALIFVLFVVLFLFRKLSLAIIIVAPVIFSVIWLAGTMSILGIRISFANASVAAMVIGLGVDYAIHIVNSFDFEVKKHAKKPITKTMRVVGSALFISFLTTLAGFSVNLLGSTEAIRVQGLTLALGVLFSFTATMLLVPVLLKLKLEVLRTQFGEHKWK